MVLIVRRLIWEPANIRHIARHHITPDEVNEVCRNSNSFPLQEEKRRLGLIGLTEDGRMLKVILQPKGKGEYYPVTAHEPDDDERHLYNRKRG